MGMSESSLRKPLAFDSQVDDPQHWSGVPNQPTKPYGQASRRFPSQPISSAIASASLRNKRHQTRSQHPPGDFSLSAPSKPIKLSLRAKESKQGRFRGFDKQGTSPHLREVLIDLVSAAPTSSVRSDNPPRRESNRAVKFDVSPRRLSNREVSERKQ